MSYINAAATWFKTELHITVPLYPSSDGKKSESLEPYLAEILGQRRTWRQPQSKKEPLSGVMLDACAIIYKQSTFTSRLAASIDWVRFGIFTGSRLSEYGQEGVKAKSTVRWNVVPNSRDVPPEWRNKPVAFIAADFEFYNDQMVLMSHAWALNAPMTVSYFRVRFRYDKSKGNFTYRKYCRVSHAFLCPIQAALSIIRRARDLNIGPDEPLGQFRNGHGKLSCLTGDHMRQTLQNTCGSAHPDPNHYLRRHSNRLGSHSLRVTACVALHNAGVGIDDICFRLRWNSDAVKLYLRDGFRDVGSFTERALVGAFAADN
jgi:hypothetical protein